LSRLDRSITEVKLNARVGGKAHAARKGEWKPQQCRVAAIAQRLRVTLDI
jgi:hypothetical protein